MSVDLKAATPDTTIPATGAFLFGADSQSASAPSVYRIDTTILQYLDSLAHTITVNGALSAPATSLTGTWITGGSATTTKPHFLVEPSGTTSTGWSTNGTGIGVNAASGFTGNLIDAQLNGSSKAFIAYNGLISGAFGRFSTGAGEINLNYYQNGVGVSSTAPFTWGSGGGASAPDVYLYRDAANVLAQRNSTSAQIFRVYNTYTDASNYERLSIGWNSGLAAFEISTYYAGTGSARALTFGTYGINNINLMTNGVVRFKVQYDGHFLALTDNVYDIGSAGALRPRSGYFGTDVRAPEMITGALKDTSGTGVMSLSGSVATFAYGVATPAGGSTSARLLFGTTSGFGIYYGSGAPSVSAAQGSIYLRSDGSSTSTRMYVNNSSGSGTTWTAVTTAA